MSFRLGAISVVSKLISFFNGDDDSDVDDDSRGVKGEFSIAEFPQVQPKIPSLDLNGSGG
jgi:hypothetical protein